MIVLDRWLAIYSAIQYNQWTWKCDWKDQITASVTHPADTGPVPTESRLPWPFASLSYPPLDALFFLFSRIPYNIHPHAVQISVRAPALEKLLVT